MKKVTTGLYVCTLALAAVVGGSVMTETAHAKIKVKAPYTKTAEVAKGKKITLSVGKKASYKVADKKIATVTGKGVVRGRKPGKTKVTVSVKKQKTTVTVKVMKKAVKKVKINTNAFFVDVRGKKKLKVIVSPGGASKKVIWSSSKKKIASVSTSGVVKGRKEGTAKITAKAADGSGKKATVKVTVGTGITGLSVPHSRILNVTLSGAKALKAADFRVQNKYGTDTSYNVTESVEQVKTSDRKRYTVLLDSASGIGEGSYVKVTVPALTGQNAREIYVGKVADYGDAGNTRTDYVAGLVGRTFSKSSSIANTNARGAIKITKIDGALPGGIVARIAKDGNSVNFAGKFTRVERGTAVTLVGTDQLGRTFSRKHVFYVGDDNTIVGTVVTRTKLAYTPDNPLTPEYDPYGDDAYSVFANPGRAVVAGAGYYSSHYDIEMDELTGIPTDILRKNTNEDGEVYWSCDFAKAIPAKAYPLTLNIVRNNDDGREVKASIPFAVNVVNGVTVTGVIRDAAGQPARYVSAEGETKMDVNGNSNYFDVMTDGNGKYTTKVIPGDYYTQAEVNGRSCDVSIGNKFTANTTKDFTLPAYRVDFTSTVPGAAVYDDYGSNIGLTDNYGNTTTIRFVEEECDANLGKMYAYLLPGTYSMLPVEEKSDTGVVKAYKTVQSSESLTAGGTVYKHYYYFDEKDNYLGTYKLSLDGTFAVSGNRTVSLIAAAYVVPE